MVYLCDFYLYYEQLEKGGRLIYCQECGKLVLVKSKTCTDKYCQKCKKERENERLKQLMRDKRKS